MEREDTIKRIFQGAGYEHIRTDEETQTMELWDPEAEQLIRFKPEPEQEIEGAADIIAKRANREGFNAGKSAAQKQMRQALGM